MSQAILEALVDEALKKKIERPKELHKLKLSYCERFGLEPPANAELIAVYERLVVEQEAKPSAEFFRLLKKRAIRTQSGVSPVAVLTKPMGCPARCVFCPTEENVPKSYLSNEPAVMRAILNDYDPFKQVTRRIAALRQNGHPTDKIELIVMGGTWSAHPKLYQKNYIRQCLNAMNSHAKKVRSLEEAQLLNESAPNRCVAIVLETRPDWIDEEEIKRMRELSCTRVEIGLQSTSDEVLELVKRGHGTQAVKDATKLLKDAGFKVSYHMMPNLPGSTVQMDIDMFRELFEDPDYKPDMSKVYPCMVVPFSELKFWYEQGRHRPYTDEELLEIILNIKPFFPRYHRVSRLIRDIPATSIIGGSHVSNLRQVAHELMKKRGVVCHCIRCREVRNHLVDPENLALNIMEYDASGGKEFFLSMDDMKEDRLCALLRLRFSSYSMTGKKHFLKELEGAAIIRELHTYGVQLPIGQKGDQGESVQHLGLGKKLMAEAEALAKKSGFKKIAVISGVGIRPYYRKLGYELEGTYMVKRLPSS